MADLSSASDDSSLAEHLATLFPYACLMVGSEEAPDLLLRVYQRATEHPPADRPDDQEGWLLDLLVKTTEAPDSDSGDATFAASAKSPSDPFRQKVAARRLDEVLPIALAACSSRERLRLAVDASSDASTPPSMSEMDRSAPWTSLRDHLRAILSEPEVGLVEKEMTDAALRDSMREWMANRFPPVPGSLRSRVRTLLETTPQTTDPHGEASASDPSSDDALLQDHLPTRSGPGAVVFVLLIGGAVLAGGIGIWSQLQPAQAPPASRPGLVAFSVDHASSMAPERSTSDRAEAARYVESAWDRRVEVPTLLGARVDGIGKLRVDDTTEVPVFLYAHPDDGTRIAVFAYSYALIDRMQPSVTLGTQVRTELARQNRLISRTEASAEGVLWRDRDDIFVAVAPQTPSDSLQSWIRP